MAATVRIRSVLVLLAVLVLGFALGRMANVAPAGAAMSMTEAAHPKSRPDVDRQLQAAMNAMMDARGAIQLTGDPDRDFIALMIPHHQAAVAMARVELRSGKRSDVRRLASGVIATQQREIAQMRSWLRGWNE